MKGKRIIIYVTAAICCLPGMAQHRFKGTLHNKTEQLSLKIDLYDESIPVPGMEFFGPCNGYLHGNIYGIWTITSSRVVDERTAVIRLSNDQGSDTQEVELTFENDTTCLFRQKGKACIKKVVNRKLVKIPADIRFTRQAD